MVKKNEAVCLGFECYNGFLYKSYCTKTMLATVSGSRTRLHFAA